MRITTDLLKKGINKDIIEVAFHQAEDEGYVQNELKMALELLKRKNMILAYLIGMNAADCQAFIQKRV